jgi:hypothetical protein
LRFTVRRPASAEVSPCCHRPSGGDIACSVHVGVARTLVAGLALENRLAPTISESDMPTNGASLRRVSGRDLLGPDRQIPHIQGVATLLGQDHRLLDSGNQPIARHSCNLTAPTDNPAKADAALPPPAKATSFQAATNR